MIAIFLLLLTRPQIVAPTLDDIIGKDRDYTTPIPKQNNYGDIDITANIFWLDK